MSRNISDTEKKKFENSIINSIVDIIFETGNVFYLYERSESNSEEKRFKEENIGKGRNNYLIISYKKNKQIDTIQLKNVHDVSEHFYDANRENVDMRHKLDLDLLQEMIKNKGTIINTNIDQSRLVFQNTMIRKFMMLKNKHVHL